MFLHANEMSNLNFYKCDQDEKNGCKMDEDVIYLFIEYKDCEWYIYEYKIDDNEYNEVLLEYNIYIYIWIDVMQTKYKIDVMQDLINETENRYKQIRVWERVWCRLTCRWKELMQTESCDGNEKMMIGWRSTWDDWNQQGED